MGGLKVYGLAMSTCTTRVAATLEELGVEYEIVPIDFSVAEHKQPPHLLRNPFGQIPALVDGDLTLFESRAISRYVARKFKGGGAGGDLLREGNPTEAAAVDVWMEVEAQQFGHPASAIFYEIVVAPMYGKKADEERWRGTSRSSARCSTCTRSGCRSPSTSPATSSASPTSTTSPTRSSSPGASTGTSSPTGRTSRPGGRISRPGRLARRPPRAWPPPPPPP